MFVPRAVRLKGVREPDRTKIERPRKKARVQSELDDSASIKIPDAAPASTEKEVDTNVTKSVDKVASHKSTSPEYLGKLLSGVELLFTDYAHQDKAGADWLKGHYRDVEGESNCELLSLPSLHHRSVF